MIHRIDSLRSVGRRASGNDLAFYARSTIARLAVFLIA